MIKYAGYSIVMQEVPDEISLALDITNCPNRCPGCHSPELQKDFGQDLEAALPALLKAYAGRISCVCFMGEGRDYTALVHCLQMVREAGLKTCLYSGHDQAPPIGLTLLDYLKLGPYIKELGGLDSPRTNQRMWRIHHLLNGLVPENITYKFQRKKV